MLTAELLSGTVIADSGYPLMTPPHRTELEHAGRHIRDHFKPVLSEPLPYQLWDLLSELEEAERKSKATEGSASPPLLG